MLPDEEEGEEKEEEDRSGTLPIAVAISYVSSGSAAVISAPEAPQKK